MKVAVCGRHFSWAEDEEEEVVEMRGSQRGGIKEGEIKDWGGEEEEKDWREERKG